MYILIYASNKERREQIRELCTQVFECGEGFIEFDIRKIENNILVIDNDEVYNFVGTTLSNLNNTYLYEQSQIFSIIKDGKILLALRKRYIIEKHWDAAKRINDVILNSDFLLKRAKPAGYPDYLQIETTSKCNAECIMCSHYYTRNRNSSYLSNDIIEKLSDTLPYLRVVALNGMGEPFINPYITSQIEEFVKFGAKITTNTNLSIINDNLLSLINNHFSSVQLSCDGATKKTYELIRKKLSFDTFIKNLSLLREKCTNININFVTVIMRQNIRELHDIVALAGRAGIKLVAFMNINSNIIINNEKDNMNNYPNVLHYYIFKARKVGECFGMEIIAPSYDVVPVMTELDRELALMDSLPMSKSNEEIEQMFMTSEKLAPYVHKNVFSREEPKKSNVKCMGICDWLLRRAYISSQGDVCICCVNHTFRCGNIKELGSFGNVWNSNYYESIRDIFYSGYLPDSCLGCGIIEGGSLKYLKIDITREFYQEPEFIKTRRQMTQKILCSPLKSEDW